jgi:tetratricopeptide (TPR) repeat protein
MAGMPRACAAAALVCLLCAPVPSAAQAKDDFVRAVIDLSLAVGGATGNEGPAVRAALDAMAKGLAQWDAAVARVETGFNGAITGAAPAEAARMRATLAATYMERGRASDAIAHLDRAVAIDPSFTPAHLLRAVARARVSRGDAAGAYAAARTLDPASAGTAYLYLAATRGTTRPERPAALAALLEGVSAGPAPTDLTVLQLNLLDDASVDAPLFVPAAYVEGFRLLAEARYPEALASLRAAAAADPLVTGTAPAGAAANAGDERARLAAADALVAKGERAAARAHLLETVRRYPTSGQAHWRLVRLNDEGGDQASAVRAAEAAARCAPVAGAAIVYATIGRLRHTALDLAAAARAYERRVALTPQSARAHLDLGTIYQALDRLDDALAEYLAAALVDPTSAAAFTSAGQLRADQGDGEGAIALLRTAVRLDANHGAARYSLGRALLRAGRADEAKPELAAFERIQKAEMEAQRRQFEENSRALDSILKGGK